MKKYFIYAIILLFTQISVADDLCLNMEVPDFTSSARYLHIKEFPTETTFAGYVQASDNSFGSAIHAEIINNRVIFSRGVTRGNMSYNLDLSTYNGSTIIGNAIFTQYHVTNGYSYASPITATTTFTVITCPAE